jgi:ABC-2 type transport system permease protein
MKLVRAHTRALTIELMRHPAYLVPTLAFPTLFFLAFAGSGPPPQASVRMATFAGFAAIGVAFFQFGVGIAVERESPWERYLRTLPVSLRVRMLARVLSAALFATTAAMLVLVAGAGVTHVPLAAAGWFALAGMLVAGAVPFALLGIALGYWVPPRGALPIANVLYLGLAYAGGMWMRPDQLPHGIRGLSPFLPSRALRDALAAAVGGTSPPVLSLLALAAFGCAFGALAVWGYRRDEGRRYR